MKTQTLSFLMFLILINSCNNSKTSNLNNGSQVTNQEEIQNEVEQTKNDSYEFYSKKGYEIMVSENIGEIKFGVKHIKIIDLLGEPEEKSEPIFSDVDGETYQTYSYKNKGIYISFRLNSDSTRTVAQIEIEEPCELKTSKNVGIGSEFEDVKNAYKEFVNPEESGSETIIVGSIYGGLVFNFKNNKVYRIFFGASAE